MDGFRQTIERHGIDRDLEWGGEMKVSVGEEGLASTEREHDLYCKCGHEATRLDRDEVRSEIHSPLFDGAVWCRKRSGTVHPGKLARGLKRAALELGVRILEHTPHLANVRRFGGVEVSTPHGEISAAKVLLATNAWAAGHRRIATRVLEKAVRIAADRRPSVLVLLRR